MLTSLASIVRDERPAYRPFRARVAAVRALSPSFRRVTFTGEDLGFFGRDGLDQRIKLFFPLPGVGLSDFGVDDPASHLAGDWYARWLALPDAARNPLRTFTIRAVRPQLREIDVDFAVHPGETSGPAGRWIAGAATGDELVIVGPDVRSRYSAGGIDWRPGHATRLLLAGDETAVPAICAVLESLPPGREATALIEVADAADALRVDTRADVRWLVRRPGERGQALHEAVADWLAGHPDVVARAAAAAPQELEDVDVDSELLWDSPDAATDDGHEFYAWLAGEAAVIKRLRRLLVSGSGIDRSRVAFMGYWRDGRAEQS